MSRRSPSAAESDINIRSSKPLSSSRHEIHGQRDESLPTTNTDSKNMSANMTSDISASQRMISATWGSLITSLFATPLDVVRVRLQSQSSPTAAPLNLSKFPAYATNFQKLPPDLGVKACCREVFWIGDNAEFCLAGNGHAHSTSGADCAVEETQKKRLHSTLDGLKKIARNEGIWTLWRGLSPTLLMAIPANVIYFTGYDWLRYNPASPVKKYSGDAYSPLVAGSTARVAAAFVVSPIEMFRTRMQATSGGTSGIFRETLLGLHRMTQSQGYTSLWRGISLTMWRDVPFSGFYWWGYEACRNYLGDVRKRTTAEGLMSSQSTHDVRSGRETESHYSTFIDSFTAGGVSGAAAALITTPFDVGKTRQQVYRHAGDDSGSVQAARKAAAKAAGSVVPEDLVMPRFLMHIYHEEGMSGLFKGWTARCLKVAPACAIMISSYEVGKRWAKSSNSKKVEKTGAV